MKISVPTTIERDAVAIRAVMPNRYAGDEDDPLADYNGCGYDTASHVLTLVFDLETGMVRDWPPGQEARIHLKVTDEGTYEVLGPSGEVLASRTNDYVPGCLPSEYGDYLVARIDASGRVSGWRPRPADVLRSFWDVS